MNKLFLLTVLSALIASCGTVGNAVIKDTSLANKAAFALNTTADRVAISNRTSSIDSINFVATTKGKSYQCYITTVAGVINSSAICSGSNSVKNNNQQCNALLKAAGRC
ncbi:hypothetical protein GCM10027155_07160 [Acinetobacter apis]|uniref:Lipoprotein n=1 Tax=Acinetobacter apis TaxID=1229165 RepID=A0A217EE54_9GAMM|nr:hypothetical protein [Acinetobacter apis]SNQ28799.1 hypothetical protein SAMN05444584_0725 [Acinetobacter apis]